MTTNRIESAEQIRDLQLSLVEMYPNTELSVDYIYGHAARAIGYLCKNLSNGKVNTQHFIRSVSWLFGLASKLGISVEEALILRFPGVCPYCLSKRCVCVKTRKQPAHSIPAYKISKELREKAGVYTNNNSQPKLDNLAATISEIYPNNESLWHIAGPWYHIAKMQEEVSEVHEAISRHEKNSKPLSVVGSEIADTLAWILGAWTIEFPKKSLDGELISYYSHNCPVCGKTPCICPPRSNRVAESVDIEGILKISSTLTELSELAPNASDQIDELKLSLEAAISSEEEPVATRAIFQTKTSLRSLERALSGAGESARQSRALIVKVQNRIRQMGY